MELALEKRDNKHSVGSSLGQRDTKSKYGIILQYSTGPYFKENYQELTFGRLEL